MAVVDVKAESQTYLCNMREVQAWCEEHGVNWRHVYRIKCGITIAVVCTYKTDERGCYYIDPASKVLAREIKAIPVKHPLVLPNVV